MSAIPWIVMAAASAVSYYTNPVAAPGEPGYTPMPQHHFRVGFENDCAFNRDRNYTHGTRLEYVKDITDTTHSYGITLMQNIYTPETHTRHAVPNEHPYAGYLALGGAYLLRGKDVGCSFEFQLGTSGRASLAKDAQRMIHSAGNMEQWDGWKEQVPSELTIQLTSRQDYRMAFIETETSGGWQTDGLAYSREAVGTFGIYGGVGLSFRFGRNLPSNMRVNGMEAGNFTRGLIDSPSYRPEAASYFVVLQGEIDYVARDLTVDGGVFHSFRYKTCSRTPWQFHGQLGLGASYHGIDYFVGALFYTRTYRTQEHDSMLGSFAISWNW